MTDAPLLQPLDECCCRTSSGLGIRIGVLVHTQQIYQDAACAVSRILAVAQEGLPSRRFLGLTCCISSIHVTDEGRAMNNVSGVSMASTALNVQVRYLS